MNHGLNIELASCMPSMKRRPTTRPFDSELSPNTKPTAPVLIICDLNGDSCLEWCNGTLWRNGTPLVQPVWYCAADCRAAPPMVVLRRRRSWWSTARAALPLMVVLRMLLRRCLWWCCAAARGGAAPPLVVVLRRS